MNFKQEKYIKIIYSILCKSYQIFSTVLENIFFRKNNSSNPLKNLGYFKYEKSDIDLNYLKKFERQKINNYLYVKPLSKKQIREIITTVFDSKFREYITSLTGFEYSIDYMIIYDRKNIKEKDRNVPTLKRAYSYVWHFDKPNSSNMLKIIIPLNISKSHGPMKVIDKFSSRSNKLYSPVIENEKTGVFTGFGDKIYGFNPTLCIHKDGIPKEKNVASQIMFQLNPYYKWSINKNISKRKSQFKNKIKIWNSEPKFPLIAYFNDERISF